MLKHTIVFTFADWKSDKLSEKQGCFTTSAKNLALVLIGMDSNISVTAEICLENLFVMARIYEIVAR